jgi:hypothetical protein
MEVSGQLNAPAAFAPRETVPGTHYIGDWASFRAGLDVMDKRKSSSYQESNPDYSVDQPVA